MLRYLIIAGGVLLLFGCSTAPKNEKKDYSSINIADATLITLSHVRAHLLLGNIQKAEQLFQAVDLTDLNGQSQLLLAELHAAKGESVEAQKVFLSALTEYQFELAQDKTGIPDTLLDYFCEEKKWPALQGYGESLISITNNNTEFLTQHTLIKNGAFTKIGLCFFYQQKWDDSQYWLEKVDKTKQISPLIYLALARAKVEQQQLSDAQRLMTQYEQFKDKVDPQSLWIAIEVYLGLNQPEMVTQVGQNMRSLFPYNEYTRKYILLTKRWNVQAIAENPIPSSSLSLPVSLEQQSTRKPYHIIKKGETLYQLSKRYGVTTPELMSWNPDLVINDISIGTRIRITPTR